MQRRVHVHVHQFRKGAFLTVFVGVTDQLRLLSIARPTALRTGNIHIGKELNVKGDRARSVADRAAQTSRVIGKVTGLAAQPLCFRRSAVDFAQLVMHISIGGDRRADIYTDGRCVDQLDLMNPLRFDFLNVIGHSFVIAEGFQRGDKAFQYHRCLSRTGHAGDDGQPVLGNVHRQRLDRMDGIGLHVNDAVRKIGLSLRSAFVYGRAGQIWPDYGGFVFRNALYRALGNDRSAVRTRAAPHFNEPVGFFQNLRVVVNQQDGVAVSDEIVHHAVQTDDVRRMQTDGRLVQNVQNARRPVAHRPCELHPLPLSGGERGGRSVQRQIA